MVKSHINLKFKATSLHPFTLQEIPKKAFPYIGWSISFYRHVGAHIIKHVIKSGEQEMSLGALDAHWASFFGFVACNTQQIKEICAGG